MPLCKPFLLLYKPSKLLCKTPTLLYKKNLSPLRYVQRGKVLFAIVLLTHTRALAPTDAPVTA